VESEKRRVSPRRKRWQKSLASLRRLPAARRLLTAAAGYVIMQSMPRERRSPSGLMFNGLPGTICHCGAIPGAACQSGIDRERRRNRFADAALDTDTW
jgi:hypothetical protein